MYIYASYWRDGIVGLEEKKKKMSKTVGGTNLYIFKCVDPFKSYTCGIHSVWKHAALCDIFKRILYTDTVGAPAAHEFLHEKQGMHPPFY